MELNETVRYPGITPDEVFALICNEDFRAGVCRKLHAASHSVAVERDGDTATVRIGRVVPTDMPDGVRKFVGETVEVVQTENWEAPDAAGARTAAVEVQVTGQPASMTGRSTVRATGEGSELTLRGEVKVKVPFIGKMVEPEIAKAIVTVLRTEATEGIAYLTD